MTRAIPSVLARAIAIAIVTFIAASTARAVVVRTAVAYRPVYRPVYHPVARTAAVVGATAVTAVAVGTVVRSLPPSCRAVMVGNVAYQQCGAAWYRPAYAGTAVSYTVVEAPR